MKAKESISCELRFYQGQVPPEMLGILQEVWPDAHKEYQAGNDLSLSFHLDYRFSPDKPLARLSPFFHLAQGFSFAASTSNMQKPPVTALFEAINLYIGRKQGIYKCLRCGHEWPSKQPHPRVCPKCKSPYWDKERKK